MLKPKVRSFVYTKANGERSNRQLLIMSVPSELYLGVEVDHLDEKEIQDLIEYIESSRSLTQDYFDEMGCKWKSFKPEGIEWTSE